MIRKKVSIGFSALAALALLLSACAPAAPATQVAPAEQEAQPTQQLPVEQEVSTPQNQPTDITAPEPSPTAGTEEPAAADKGFVLFYEEQAEFHAFAPDGSELFKSPAPGLKYPTPWTLSVVDGAVYYITDTDPQDKKMVRSSEAGVQPVNIPTKDLSAFTVSPDEKLIVWSTLDPNSGTSYLFTANPDGSNVKQIANYPVQNRMAFWFLPVEWTADGKLIFDRQMTGLGGYILYGGHNGLYSYDPATGQIETIVPAEENHGLCLDSYREDLDRVVFNCGKDGPDMTIRNLSDQSETKLPRMPEQGAAGSSHFSPSGKWLAYAVARSNPDNESGEVVIVPADLSADPTPIAKVDNKTFPAVQGWVDEDTLLFTRNQWPNSTVWTINADGSDVKQVAQGQWIGWIP